MAKLEDIPKKRFFQAPENYFEELPGRIQKRITGQQRQFEERVIFRYALQYVMPLLVAAAALLYYDRSKPSQDPEVILAAVSTQELIDYLQDSDMTTDDVLEDLEFTTHELEAIEADVYHGRSDAMDIKGN